MNICMRNLVALTFFVSACFAPTFAAAPPDEQASELTVPEIFDKLRLGGNLIVMRHAATDHDAKDNDQAHPENCAANRSLTDRGRLNANGWGKVLHASNVPVARVYASLYCRAVETAERLRYGNVITSVGLTSPAGLGDTEAEHRAVEFRNLLDHIPAGTNVIAVTHSPNIIAAFGAGYANLGEADAVVLRIGPVGAQLVGRLPLRAVAAYAHAAHLPSLDDVGGLDAAKP